MAERHEWARKNQGWALTADIAEQARKFDWDGDWPEVDTDGHLTGEVVEPRGSDQWTVVDVIQPPAGPAYVHEGSGAWMAVVRTADLQARREIETAAPSCEGIIGGVTIEQGLNSDWLVRIQLRSTDAAKLVAFLERMKQEGSAMGLITTAEELADAIVSDPERVAACLGRINRFGGQVPHCTVLRHSLEVYHRIDADPDSSDAARLWALLHDCHEILTGDVVRPFVSARLRMDQQAIDAVIVRRLPLLVPLPDSISWQQVVAADRAVGEWEIQQTQQGHAPYPFPEFRVVQGQRFSEVVRGGVPELPSVPEVYDWWQAWSRLVRELITIGGAA